MARPRPDLTKALAEANALIDDVCVCGHTSGEHGRGGDRWTGPVGEGPCVSDRHCGCEKFRRAPLKVVEA